MYVDKSLYFIDTVGLAAGTAWGTLWAHTTSNISDTIDLLDTANRRICAGGNLIISCTTQPAQAAGGTTRFSLLNSAAAGLGTNTVLWTSGEIDDLVVAAYVANTIIYTVKMPMEFPLRYIGMEFYFTTTAWTAGTLECYIAPDSPIPPSGYQV